MRLLSRLTAAALLALLPFGAALAERKTVCTITVNSPDEKNVFRRYLPQEDYDFVELVEHGRSDWLASSCRAGVRCDVLLISGHFDDGTQFYSDRPGVREYLPVEELERASCSDSCPGLFSQLKEVYLFGCNTLNAQALRSTTSEIGRSLARAGHSPADVERLTRLLDEQHADSNRDRMRQIFHDVPVIYGFSSKAPLGATAGPVLERYFQSGGKAEVGMGRASAGLLKLFAPVAMTATSGVAGAELQSAYRGDVCAFADDRQSVAQRLEFVHRLFERDMADVRMFLDRIERAVSSLGPADREHADVATALDALARDRVARSRFMEFARDADQASTRARMIEVAHALGWLTESEQRAELVQMLSDHLARNAIGPAEIDLACSLQSRHALGNSIEALQSAAMTRSGAPYFAVLACLGSSQARGQMLQALAGTDERAVELAQVYLQHHPISDVLELRAVATSIARMRGSDAQVRALETLARLRLSDAEALTSLMQVFPTAKSLNVQRAIAGVLIRADYTSLARTELVRALREHRLKSLEGPDVIDVLIRRLQS